MNLKTLHSKDYHNLLDNIVKNNLLSKSTNLEKVLIKMGEALEMERGIIKTQISTIMRKDIENKLFENQKDIPREECKYRSGYFFEVMKNHGWTNPDMARNTNLDTLKEQEIVPPQTEYELENYEYINLIRDTIKFLKDNALQKLKTNHFMSLVEPKDVKLTLHDWRAQLSIAESFFDHKEKVPVNTQHILLHCIATMASNNDAAHEYFKLRDNTHTLTGKQLSKYRKGIVKNRLAIFNPRDRITAIMWDYLGVKCKSCNSWRVIELPGTGITFRAGCLDCQCTSVVVQPIKCNTCAVLFFEDHIIQLEDKTKCPYCEEKFSSIVIDKIKTIGDL